jgi:hypothetical protein
VSILDWIAQIYAVKVGAHPPDTPAKLHDRDARLSLKIGSHLLVADEHGGQIHHGVLRCSVYMTPLQPVTSSPFTNLQRLLVMLPEVAQ